MADQKVKINFETSSNTKGVEDVQRELDKLNIEANEAERVARELRQEIEKLDSSDAKLARTLKKEAQALDDVAEKARDTHRVYQQYGSTVGNVQAKKTRLNKTNRHMSLGFLEVSRAVEDAQYGLRGVLNNIPQIITLFGGGAGLAGAISLAAVGFTQLLERTKKSEKALEDFGDKLDGIRNQAVARLVNEMNRADLLSGFETSQDSAAAKARKTADAMEREIAAARTLRNLDLELSNAKAAEEIAKVNADSSLSESEKIRRVDAIRKGAREEQNAAELETVREDLRKAEQELNVTQAEIDKLKRKRASVEANRLGANAIKDAEDKAEELKEPSSEAFKELRNFENLRGINNFNRSDGGGLGYDARAELSKRREKFIDDVAKIFGELDKELAKDEAAQSPAVVEDILESILKLVEKNDLAREKAGTPETKADEAIRGLAKRAKEAREALKLSVEAAANVRDVKLRLEGQDKVLSEYGPKLEDLKKELANNQSKVDVLEASVPKIEQRNEVTARTNETTTTAALQSSSASDAVAVAQSLNEQMGGSNESLLLILEALKDSQIKGKEVGEVQRAILELMHGELGRGGESRQELQKLDSALRTNSDATTRLLEGMVVQQNAQRARLDSLERVMRQMGRDGNVPKT